MSRNGPPPRNFAGRLPAYADMRPEVFGLMTPVDFLGLLELNYTFDQEMLGPDMFGPHPYAHLTEDQRYLFYAFIHYPHQFFKFDAKKWVIKSTIDPRFQFTRASDYLTRIIENDFPPEALMSFPEAIAYGNHLLDMGPDYVSNVNVIRHLSRRSPQQEHKVNWGRDGF